MFTFKGFGLPEKCCNFLIYIFIYVYSVNLPQGDNISLVFTQYALISPVFSQFIPGGVIFPLPAPLPPHPVAVKPDRKIAREDLFAVHRDYYEGTKYSRK